MEDARDEQWKALCKQASTEKDPEKLFELISEINRLLEQKRGIGMSLDKPDS
jgi:hypothetical protein